jgi:hypothetical protein
MKSIEVSLRTEFKHIFEPIPHVDKLPTDVIARIKLKDSSKTITTRSYASPKKYKEAWLILIHRHLDAGRIRPSSSPFASPAFLTPKTDPTILPRWVNDYHQLNTNTVMDSHPLPHVDDILADCAKGKLWGVMDMTDSFFQTRLHPDDIPLTAVTTPLGLYEWTVMPMGARNSPSIQQWWVTMALCPYIGRICHVYIDDIVIWSSSVEEHIINTHLFCWEIDFLGHHISTRGIEAHDKKVSRILDWPILQSASDVRAFLGLVRYIANFLPKLADHTAVLTLLTEKHCDCLFPSWTDTHQLAFEQIKQLVVSRECLTVIDHDALDANSIFVTTDASDKWSGAMLSFGPTWETARPVAFDSMTFKGSELNYPIHEKELLAIIRALR